MKSQILTLVLVLIFSFLPLKETFTQQFAMSAKIEKKKISRIREVVLKDTVIINSTFLGNKYRNFYGNEAPSRLDIIWKTYLGEGDTQVGKIIKHWKGAGWTGQPLLIKIRDTLYIIQGAYDHKLKKILAENGKIIDEFQFDDVLKGTGTIWYNKKAKNPKEKLIILQGSRRGFGLSPYAPVVKSFRAIAFADYSELWAYNSKKMYSYSRDVDASALVINDTGYIGLENGLFLVFDPDPQKAEIREGIKQPKIYDIDTLFFENDKISHKTNLVTEGSPAYLQGKIYVEAGSGHLFAYNMQTKKIDWYLSTGADMDGTPVVTKDSCLIITFEKEYIPGHGGVMKIDPRKSPENSVIWFFPTGDTTYFYWEGGIVGSATVNDIYFPDNPKISGLTAFTAIDGYFYVVKHDEITKETSLGPMLKKSYPKPKLIFKYRTGPAIATPIFVKNRIVVPTYEGLYLFEYDENLNFKLLDKIVLDEFEATPFVWNKRIYLACRNGYLYCFGEK